MRAQNREPIFRRILVAIDASPHSLAALRAATSLAAHLNAELLGLYVEDIKLLRLAELPLAREIGLFSSFPRQIDRQQIEQQLQTQARQARRALEAQASRARLRWSFRVARGEIAVELLMAALESDLIMLGRAGWSRGRRLGSTARALVAQADRQTMILQEGAQIRPPVGVVFDGSPLSWKALSAASVLVEGSQLYLVIIILANEVEEARRLQTQASDWLRQQGLQASYRWLVDMDGTRLAQIVSSEGCGALVMHGALDLLQGSELAEFVEATRCPLLLVR